MMFEGEELLEVLGRTEDGIELRNEYGRYCRVLSKAEALALNLDQFVGIGNRRRIRFLRQRSQRFAIHAGSRTTRRMTNGHGINISHPLIREHRSF